MNAENILDGVGRRFIDNQILEGQFKEGMMEGYGRAIYVDGNYYVGEFKADNSHGRGKYVWNSG